MSKKSKRRKKANADKNIVDSSKQKITIKVADIDNNEVSSYTAEDIEVDEEAPEQISEQSFEQEDPDKTSIDNQDLELSENDLDESNDQIDNYDAELDNIESDEQLVDVHRVELDVEPEEINVAVAQLSKINLDDQSSDQEKNRHHFYQKPVFWFTLGLFVGVIVFVINSILSLPVVTVRQKNYNATQTPEAIASDIFEQLKQQKITFEHNQTSVDLAMPEAGIRLDLANLTEQVNSRRRTTLENLFWKSKIEPKFKIDYATLQSLLNQTFKEELIEPINASAKYNSETHKFELSGAKNGHQVDAKTVLADSSQIKLGESLKIKVTYQEVQPQLSSASVQKTVDYLNQRLALRLNLNHNGKLLYFVDPWDVADWTVMTTNETGTELKIDFDQTKIETFINKTVSPQIRRGVVNKRVLINDSGEVLQVLQEGRRGLGAVNPGNAAEEIRQALLNNRNLEFDLDIQEIDFKTEKVNFNGQKWILVDLSEQSTTLYSGNTALQRFTISSGVAPWQTPTGTFYVWYKNPKQVMTGGSRAVGDYYYLPNVTWNTYFTHSGVGFHTAYWHNNFGHPMSHGCINMREADAKVVYDFAPIGTMVVVQN